VFIWSADVSSSSQSWTAKLLHKFNDVVWHLSWSVTGNILAVSGGDNKVHPLTHSLTHRLIHSLTLSSVSQQLSNSLVTLYTWC